MLMNALYGRDATCLYLEEVSVCFKKRKTLREQQEDVQLIMNLFKLVIALSLCQDHKMLANRWVIHEVAGLSLAN